jgi:hypothetical protein
VRCRTPAGRGYGHVPDIETGVPAMSRIGSALLGFCLAALSVMASTVTPA